MRPIEQLVDSNVSRQGFAFVQLCHIPSNACICESPACELTSLWTSRFSVYKLCLLGFLLTFQVLGQLWPFSCGHCQVLGQLCKGPSGWLWSLSLRLRNDSTFFVLSFLATNGSSLGTMEIPRNAIDVFNLTDDEALLLVLHQGPTIVLFGRKTCPLARAAWSYIQRLAPSEPSVRFIFVNSDKMGPDAESPRLSFLSNGCLLYILSGYSETVFRREVEKFKKIFEEQNHKVRETQRLHLVMERSVIENKLSQGNFFFSFFLEFTFHRTRTPLELS